MQETKESILIPSAKTGNLLATDYVLNMLGFNVINGWGGAYPFGNQYGDHQPRWQ